MMSCAALGSGTALGGAAVRHRLVRRCYTGEALPRCTALPGTPRRQHTPVVARSTKGARKFADFLKFEEVSGHH
jgi:hypothetical protein